MNFFLQFLCTAIPLWYACKRSLSKQGVEVNHVTTFTFGYMFYWVLPIFVGDLLKFWTIPLWADLYDQVAGKLEYLVAILLIYLSFMAGDILAVKLFPKARTLPKRYPVRRLPLLLLYFPILSIVAYTAFVNRDLLTMQYGFAGMDDDWTIGRVVAGIVMLGVFALLHITSHDTEKLTKRFRSIFVWPFLLGCVYLLILGVRLYVVSFVIMIIVYRTCFKERTSAKTLLLAGGIGVLISATIGVIRVRGDLSSAAGNILTESIFTSFSLIYFLANSQIAWLNIPKYLAYDLANVIPTIFWPSKGAFMTFPYVYSPVGALNSFVSFNYNFGVLGTMAFLFTLPLVWQCIRTRTSGRYSQVAYPMLSGWLTFTFFRDPFSVSIVKCMLEFSILIPALLLALNHLTLHRPLKTK